jgi:nitroimidazol reductase NimA-like FMN-containing flavoprotein (pyridoxamine 5'-phosphate oxidase superfamily)
VRLLRAGTPVCVEVTLLDGLVASRAAKSHSMNYRSVVVFGTADAVADEAVKRAIFERMTARYFPDRRAGRDYTPARAGELRAVELLAVRVEELSAKARSGPPLGPHDAEDEAVGSRFVVLLPGVDV